MEKRTNIRIPDILMILTMGITVLSQLKWNYQNQTRTAMYAVWFICFLSMMLDRKKVRTTGFGKLFLFSTIGVVGYCFIMRGLGDTGYANSVMNRFMPISCFSYWLGVLVATGKRREKVIKGTLVSYFIFCIMFALSLRFFEFKNISAWLSSMNYNYGAGKNQVGMVLACASMIGFFYVLPRCKNRTWNILTILGSAICIVGIALVQCRTALVAMAFAAGFALLMQGKLKWQYIVVGMLAIVAVLANDTIWSYIDHVFFISKYSGQGANAFLSGRLGTYQMAVETISENFFFGVGDYYVDCLYLQLLAEGGLIEFCLVIPVIIKRIGNGIRYKNRGYSYQNLGLILTIYYVITSFLEAQTPFGPGTSACVFWILCGYIDVIKKTDNS